MDDITNWIVIRASGVGTYLALFATVAWGLIATTSFFSTRLAKSASVLIHQVLGSVALALLVIHLVGLAIDHFVQFEVLDLFIPLRTNVRPEAVALGILSMYAIVLVLITSWVRKLIGAVWWRRFHVLAAPAFALALVHGIVVGTDTTKRWLWWTYVGTALVIVFLLLVRALTGRAQPQHRPARERASPPHRQRPPAPEGAPAARS
jgi:methionine sulfoxide reductase heme-binding subunit